MGCRGVPNPYRKYQLQELGISPFLIYRCCCGYDVFRRDYIFCWIPLFKQLYVLGHPCICWTVRKHPPWYLYLYEYLRRCHHPGAAIRTPVPRYHTQFDEIIRSRHNTGMILKELTLLATCHAASRSLNITVLRFASVSTGIGEIIPL